VIRRSSHLKAEGIIKAIFADVNGYMAGRKMDDDITLVVIKVDGFPESDMDFQI
jgi:serine phosphatase RsbU (regulator of sigma subunit)